jgi:glycosyltransferase involved in cell wall biosynthesis
MEILISDNCSTDGTLAIIQNYAARDGRVNWWKNPANMGLVGNFNACFAKAQGQYIKCICADDKLIDRSALSRMVKQFEKDESISVVLAGSLIIDSQSQIICRRHPFKAAGVFDGKRVVVQCFAQNKNLLCGSSTMYRKKSGTLIYSEFFPQISDWRLGCQFLENGQLAYIDLPMCAWREHPGQQTEINRRTTPCSDEHRKLIEEYVGRPWFFEYATPQMLFMQIYQLRKHYGVRAGAVVEVMLSKLGRGNYLLLLIKRKLTRPFRQLWAKLKKAKRPAVSPENAV